MAVDDRTGLFRAAQRTALGQLENNAASFGTRFPDDTSCGQAYRPRQQMGYWEGSNVGWSTGFWNGMCWLTYEMCGRPAFRTRAQHPAYAEAAASHLARSRELLVWDLEVDWRSGQERDSSATAIAVCGLLELAGQLGEAGSRYREAALDVLESLVRNCAAASGHGRGLLAHGVYSQPEGRGVNESNLWGDYHFLEALARANHGWTSFWLEQGMVPAEVAQELDAPLWADYDLLGAFPRIGSRQHSFWRADASA